MWDASIFIKVNVKPTFNITSNFELLKPTDLTPKGIEGTNKAVVH
ncbi:hypothetical protein IC006_0680 [Sulfuracidifex tepidarius]|uniref:Uncharacterized protein n=1 Tax=Sulfuracidifex tepidarius TaxID=1294262 RepID=A0A510DT56_9CREN|nr:hypothetical protein IC006_0680 [Sulfuracidifex tepidarius]BBG26149.1 hypothetical protein IC007_0654 [Sulfuracidifex tepidarius]